MIFQCVACRALGVASGVVVEGVRAGLPCPTCNAITWLPTIGAGVAVDVVAAMPAVPALPVLPPPVTSLALPASSIEAPAIAAPPAALVPTTTTALATTFDAATIARVDDKLVAPISEAQERLAARFTRLLGEQWHNDVEHRSLLKAAAAESELAFVGARYRAVLDVVREEPRARAAQQELIGLAMATMQPTVSSSSSAGSSASTIVKVVLGLIIVGGLIATGIAGARWMASSMAPLSSIE